MGGTSATCKDAGADRRPVLCGADTLPACAGCPCGSWEGWDGGCCGEGAGGHADGVAGCCAGRKPIFLLNGDMAAAKSCCVYANV
jgi:hypothetical protein